MPVLFERADYQAVVVPALAPPDGVASDFESPPTSNAAGYATLAVCLALVAVSAAVRLYIRVVRPWRLTVEDFLGIAGVGLFVGYVYQCYSLLRFPGFYIHQWNVRLEDMSHVLYAYYIGAVCYNLTIGFLKAAILLEWLAVFNPKRIRNTFFWTSHVVLWVNVAYYTANFFAINFTCTPHAKIWDKTIQGGSCIDDGALYFSGAIVNLISDIVIFLIPQRVIWTLNMPTIKKIKASVVFSLGLLCCVLAILRVTINVELLTVQDFTYYLGTVALYAVAESTVVILIFTVPAFPQAFAPLWRKWDRKKPGNSGSSDGASRNGTGAGKGQREYERIEESGHALHAIK
ncbi:hypothetical protein F4780DRAFT_793907 [Xylariomycetidae sp. FL0641]|nr:hypothetical protein F4780DRAFT_793907 [Xylariomycetidae sp. FL0641]